MKHIKTPIDVFPHWAQTDIADADGTALVSCASGHEGEMIAGEIKRALNYHDRMLTICMQLVRAERIANEHEDFTMLVNVTESARALLAEMEATE